MEEKVKQMFGDLMMQIAALQEALDIERSKNKELNDKLEEANSTKTK